MAIHWKIPFKPLRSTATYTVNIYDESYSGSPITLKGGSEPFSTQEDDDDDMFTPIRTQSGYLRIVDDGEDAAGNAFNWKSMLPSTDTDRPVTLTKTVGNTTTTAWQGFMQAQNFGGVLYGNPQEREYPVQCALAVTEGTDVDYQHVGIENFAYLLNEIVSSIPSLTIENIIIQGGADARKWLLTKIDWMNFASIDGDGNMSARYNLYQCLEDMCRYWGYTARTSGKNIVLVCADDTDIESGFLTLTRANLLTMAGGTSAGTIVSGFSSATLTGTEFASVNNNDFRMRGPNKATVTADCYSADSDVIEIYPASVIDTMNAGGSYTPSGNTGFGGSSAYVHYTNDLTSFTADMLTGTARTGYGSFNIGTYVTGSGHQSMCVIRITRSYTSSSADAYASLQTTRPHVFSDGYFKVSCEYYRNAEKYKNYVDGSGIGKANMYIRFGVGMTRATAKWYNGNANASWSNTMTAFKVPAGGLESEILGANSRMRSTDAMPCGYVFIDFLGSDDIEETNGVREFDIVDLIVTYKRNESIYETTSTAHGNFAKLVDREMTDRHVYSATNTGNVRDEWNADCIFASENSSKFGYGVLINPDGSYFTTTTYGSSTTPVRPEQHLADRVTSYWASAKRKLELDLRTDAIADISPVYKMTVDGTTLYPIAISHNWRDDVTTLSLMEL